MMRRSVRKRAGFDISKVSPIDFAHETFIPVLFSHAVEDDFVPKHHSERLHEKYGGDKNYGAPYSSPQGTSPAPDIRLRSFRLCPAISALLMAARGSRLRPRFDTAIATPLPAMQ